MIPSQVPSHLKNCEDALCNKTSIEAQRVREKGFAAITLLLSYHPEIPVICNPYDYSTGKCWKITGTKNKSVFSRVISCGNLFAIINDGRAGDLYNSYLSREGNYYPGESNKGKKVPKPSYNETDLNHVKKTLYFGSVPHYIYATYKKHFINVFDTDLYSGVTRRYLFRVTNHSIAPTDFCQIKGVLYYIGQEGYEISLYHCESGCKVLTMSSHPFQYVVTCDSYVVIVNSKFLAVLVQDTYED
jgi:hypothetical protein